MTTATTSERRWFACKDVHAYNRAPEQPENGFAGPGRAFTWLAESGLITRREHPQLGVEYEGLGTEWFIVADDGRRPTCMTDN